MFIHIYSRLFTKIKGNIDTMKEIDKSKSPEMIHIIALLNKHISKVELKTLKNLEEDFIEYEELVKVYNKRIRSLNDYKKSSSKKAKKLSLYLQYVNQKEYDNILEKHHMIETRMNEIHSTLKPIVNSFYERAETYGRGLGEIILEEYKNYHFIQFKDQVKEVIEHEN